MKRSLNFTLKWFVDFLSVHLAFQNANKLILILFLLLCNYVGYAQVDLYITNPYLSLKEPTSGETISASNTINNKGNDYVYYTYTGYYLSQDSSFSSSNDTYLTSSYSYYLYNGSSNNQSVDLTIPASAKPGTYYVLFVADYYNSITESNEKNNVSSIKITVLQPSIDLVISDLRLTFSIISAGSSLYVSNYVNNEGETSSGYNYTGYYLSSDNILDINSDIYIGNHSSYSVGGNNSTYQSGSLTIPSTVKDGSYYLFAFADYQNSISETNEKNNLSSTSITIAKPDLVIKNATSNLNSVSAGGDLKAYSFLNNQGSSNSVSSTTGFYLSYDTIFNKTSDTYLTSTYANSLVAGGTTAQTTNITIPSTVGSGTFYLLFVADYNFEVAESNEKNNVRYLTLSITKPEVDLQISNASLSTTHVSAGSSISVSSYLKNAGKSNIAGSYTGYFLSEDNEFDINDDSFLGSEYVSSVSGNGSISQYSTISIPSAIEDGNHYILFVADYKDFVYESNEKNNVTSVLITVGKPDFTISNVTLSLTNIEMGNELYAYSFLTNLGTANASASNVGYYLSEDTVWDNNDKFLSNLYVNSIASGSSNLITNNFSIPTSIESGSYYLIIVSDYKSSLTESNEENNYAHAKINVQPRNIDLVIRKASVGATKVTSGESLTLANTLMNTGKSYADYNYTGFYLSKDTVWDSVEDVFLTYTSSYSLSGGSSVNQSASITIPSSSVAGDYYILFVADYSKIIDELNEKNNVSAVGIKIESPKIDLVITNPSVDAQISSGSYVYVTNYLKNQGTSYASYSNTGYYLSSDSIYNAGDDTYLGYYSGTDVGGGVSYYQKTSVYIPSSIINGNYYLLFIADYSNSINEVNEDNNVKYLAVKITTPYADLVVTNNTLNISQGSPGTSFYATNYINNKGTKYVSSVSTGYYFSKDTIWDNTDTYMSNYYSYGISGGGSAYQSLYLTVPTTATAGNYYILFIADFYKSVEEENEKNNVKYVSFKVIKALTDVTITGQYLNTNETSAGSSIYAYNYAYNAGTNYVNYVYTGYYFSKDSILDKTDTYLNSTYSYSLSAGNTAYQYSLLNVPTTASEGTYYILFAADYLNYISEDNERNNVKYSKIKISQYTSNVDLSISAVSWATYMKAGESYFVSNYLKNNGTSYANGTSTGYYLSRDKVFDYNDILLDSIYDSGVSSGSSNYQNSYIYIPYGVKQGSYYLLYVADYGNSVIESNENNNVYAVSVTIDDITGSFEGNESMKLSVHPNPATTNVKVKIPSSFTGKINYSLINNLGGEVKIGSFQGTGLEVETIDLSDIEKGAYILRVINGDNRAEEKIVIY